MAEVAVVDIAIVVPVLREHDAVGVDALAGMDSLKAAGFRASVFSADVEGVAGSVGRVSDLMNRSSRCWPIVLFHHSFGWPGTLDLLSASRARKLVKYHNVTPPEYFVGHSEAHVAACVAGRSQIGEIVGVGIDGVIGDSTFNSQEYVAAGLDPVRARVAPPLAATEELLLEPADIVTLDRFNDGAINILVVGRIAPNKNHSLAVEVLATLRQELGRSARLICVGKHDERLATYSAALRRHAERLNVCADVHWLGEASRSVLKAVYVAADALLVTSLHEGFCVPIAEAMALGVPIVALDRAAVGETLGGAGVLLSDPDPLGFALAIDLIRSDDVARAALVRAGLERFASSFARPVASKSLVDAVSDLCA